MGHWKPNKTGQSIFDTNIRPMGFIGDDITSPENQRLEPKEIDGCRFFFSFLERGVIFDFLGYSR